jgi:hypothetical protein
MTAVGDIARAITIPLSTHQKTEPRMQSCVIRQRMQRKAARELGCDGTEERFQETGCEHSRNGSHGRLKVLPSESEQQARDKACDRDYWDHEGADRPNC